MKIAITGGTGLVGRALTKLLIEKGHQVIILTRSPKQDEKSITYVEWLTAQAFPEEKLEGVDAIVNLAGESINNGRWTEGQKKKIYDSRILATEEVLRIIRALEHKPSNLINASAIGIYPASLDTNYTEQESNLGKDFLAKTVADWEQKAEEASMLGVKVAYARFGIILDKTEGALPLMALPYKLFVGGKIGNGQNWMSWIHIQDVAESILFAIEQNLSGPFNVVSPNPIRMNDFGKILASVLGRPHYFPVPAFALKIALGEKSQLVIEGQHVTPQVLLQNKFSFQFPDLENALKDIYE